MKPIVKMLLDRSEKLTPMNDTAHTPTPLPQIELPSLLELAENKLSYAGPQDRTINIKVARNTLKMIVERERQQHAALVAALESAELSCTQAKLANGIGKKTKAQQISFLLASFELLANEARAALSATKE